MLIKYAVVYTYNRTGKLKTDGTSSVTIRAYMDGKNKYFNTGIYIEPTQWSGKNVNWIKRHPNQYRYNEQIRKMLSEMTAFEFDLVNRGEALSLERLADYDQDNLSITFTEFIEQQLEVTRITYNRSSYTDQRQTFDKLKLFKPVISFRELNHKLIENFNTFLYQSGRMGVNTIAKHHKNLKKFVNLAIKEDYLDVNKNPYKKFKVKKQPTQRIHLSEEELEIIEKLIFDKDQEHLELVRDFFLFMCYTGLRYSDASILIGNSFTQSSEGLILHHTATKTGKHMRLNLRKLFAGKPEKLINKYLDRHDDIYFDDPDEPMQIFFGLTNQYVNRELKVIVKQLQVRQSVKGQISCHVARHTFGTIMAGKIDVTYLQKLMQHAKIKETMIYVNINQKRVDDALDKIEW